MRTLSENIMRAVDDFDDIKAAIEEHGTTLKQTPTNQYAPAISSLSIEGHINIDTIYPIGSIYMSVNSVNPNILFGGEWLQITSRFLLAAGDDYEAGATGGEETHLLTTGEMPRHTHSQVEHTHSFSGTTNGAGLHSHSYQVTSGTGAAQFQAAYGQGLGKDVGTLNTSELGEHTHIMSGTTTSASGLNDNTGNDQAHNNMPPYLVVYMWQRAA